MKSWKQIKERFIESMIKKSERKSYHIFVFGLCLLCYGLYCYFAFKYIEDWQQLILSDSLAFCVILWGIQTISFWLIDFYKDRINQWVEKNRKKEDLDD